jgi:hypothetical protein
MLQRFRYPASAPELQVKFSGDLSQLEDAHVEATLRGSQIVRDDYEARDFRLAAEWKEHTLSVPRLEWSDRAGVLPAPRPGAGRTAAPLSRPGAASISSHC